MGSKYLRRWRRKTFQISSKSKAASVIATTILKAFQPLTKLKNAASFAAFAESFEHKVTNNFYSTSKR